MGLREETTSARRVIFASQIESDGQNLLLRL